MPRVEMVRVFNVHWSFSEFSPDWPQYRPDEHRAYETFEEAAQDAGKCLELVPDSLVTIDTEVMSIAEFQALLEVDGPAPLACGGDRCNHCGQLYSEPNDRCVGHSAEATRS